MLAQKEIDWNHKMNWSQQVIAILTMLFLPSTFIAVSPLPLLSFLIRPILQIDTLYYAAFQLGPPARRKCLEISILDILYFRRFYNSWTFLLILYLAGGQDQE
jgi:hypothetical protein